MKRRNFLKLLGISPIVPSVLMAKEKFGPSERDKSFAKLTEISDYGTTSRPFIWHNDIWFFADQNIIMWCPKNELASFNSSSNTWRKITLGSYDTYDFWVHEEGKLYWCGKKERYEILSMAQDGSISIRFDCNFEN
jgi:hypothetical protein